MQAVTFSTDGKGYWSRAKKTVGITNMRLSYVNDEQDFGELRVYFNTKDWDVNTDGLIYTDKLFLSCLRDFLNAQSLAGQDVDYSEQGMQGDNYVSLDVGAAFIAAWDAKFKVLTA